MKQQCGTKQKIYIAGMVLLSAVLVIVAFSAIKHWGKAYYDDIYVASPDGEYTLIIKEWGALGGTGADIYIESASSWWPRATRRKIGNTIADDCVYPFKDGYYQVSWESECVVIRYYSGRQKENPSDVDAWMGYIEYTFN